MFIGKQQLKVREEKQQVVMLRQVGRMRHRGIGYLGGIRPGIILQIHYRRIEGCRAKWIYNPFALHLLI